jgi:hypothetical protein
MKNVYQILEQKEADLNRVRRELESLQVVASLLSDEEPAKKPTSAEKAPLDEDSEATGTKGLFSSVASTRSGFWTRK